MKKLALGALCIGFLAACGGGGDNNNDNTNDSSEVTDVNPPDDGTTIDAPPGGGTCDPLMQTGCNANERCTWIWDALDNPATEMVEAQVGHLGCASNATGTVADAGQCTRSGPAFPDAVPASPGTGASVADDCVKGDYCIAGTCKKICDHQGGQPSCGDDFACNRYSGIFLSMGMTIAGVCDPKCNPVTQQTLSGNLNACNSLDATMPNQGCYTTAGTTAIGIGFSCARVPAPAKGLTDRMPAYGPASGGVYSNGCEAGYIPAYADADDDTITNCSGTCAPADSDNSTPALKAAAAGDVTKPAKLVDVATPRNGDGTCTVGKKGSSGGAEDCHYLWTSNTDDMDMVIESPFNDTVGLCFPFSDYTYDNDADATTPEIGYFSCADLPPVGGDPMSTVHGFTADEVGCYSWARTQTIPAPPHSAHKRAPLKIRTVTARPGQAAFRHILL